MLLRHCFHSMQYWISKRIFIHIGRTQQQQRQQQSQKRHSFVSFFSIDFGMMCDLSTIYSHSINDHDEWSLKLKFRQVNVRC